jgi:FAD/FMN-containing dehydrogenase
LADLRAGFLDGCRRVVGDAGVLVDPEVTASYVIDWTGRFRGSTPAVLRPASTAEVAQVVALARRHRVALVAWSPVACRWRARRWSAWAG